MENKAQRQPFINATRFLLQGSGLTVWRNGFWGKKKKKEQLQIPLHTRKKI